MRWVSERWVSERWLSERWVLAGRQPAEQKKLEQFIKETQPDVIVVGAKDLRCRTLKQQLDDVVNLCQTRRFLPRQIDVLYADQVRVRVRGCRVHPPRRARRPGPHAHPASVWASLLCADHVPAPKPALRGPAARGVCAAAASRGVCGVVEMPVGRVRGGAGCGAAVRALGAGGAGVPAVPPHAPRRRVPRSPPTGLHTHTHTYAASHARTRTHRHIHTPRLDGECRSSEAGSRHGGGVSLC